MSDTGNTKKRGSELGAVLAGASPEAKAVLVEILKVERDHLPQKNPSATKLAREIASLIRKAVP